MVDETSGSGTSCLVCQSRVPAGQRFCGTCGTPVRATGMSSDAPASDPPTLSAAAQPAGSQLPASPWPPAAPPDPTATSPAGDPPSSPSWSSQATGTPAGSEYGGSPSYSATSFPPGTMPYAATTPNKPYSGGVVLAGLIASLFMPLISLVIALVLGANESNPTRQAQLRTWAMVSGVVMFVGIIAVVGLFSASVSMGL